jgi:hypothetical protein
MHNTALLTVGIVLTIRGLITLGDSTTVGVILDTALTAATLL